MRNLGSACETSGSVSPKPLSSNKDLASLGLRVSFVPCTVKGVDAFVSATKLSGNSGIVKLVAVWNSSLLITAMSLEVSECDSVIVRVTDLLLRLYEWLGLLSCEVSEPNVSACLVVEGWASACLPFTVVELLEIVVLGDVQEFKVTVVLLDVKVSVDFTVKESLEALPHCCSVQGVLVVLEQRSPICQITLARLHNFLESTIVGDHILFDLDFSVWWLLPNTCHHVTVLCQNTTSFDLSGVSKSVITTTLSSTGTSFSVISLERLILWESSIYTWLPRGILLHSVTVGGVEPVLKLSSLSSVADKGLAGIRASVFSGPLEERMVNFLISGSKPSPTWWWLTNSIVSVSHFLQGEADWAAQASTRLTGLAGWAIATSLTCGITITAINSSVSEFVSIATVC